MKFLVLVFCCVVVASATPFGDWRRREHGRFPNKKLNVAKQESKSSAGDNGVSVSSGSAAAGLNSRPNKGEVNVAKQSSKSEAGDNGVAMSSGSANAGRVKRTVVVYGDPAPVVLTPVIVPGHTVVTSAKQVSNAISADGPANAIGSASAVNVNAREKRDVAKGKLTVVNPSGSRGAISIAQGTVVTE